MNESVGEGRKARGRKEENTRGKCVNCATRQRKLCGEKPAQKQPDGDGFDPPLLAGTDFGGYKSMEGRDLGQPNSFTGFHLLAFSGCGGGGADGKLGDAVLFWVVYETEVFQNVVSEFQRIVELILMIIE